MATRKTEYFLQQTYADMELDPPDDIEGYGSWSVQAISGCGGYGDPMVPDRREDASCWILWRCDRAGAT